MKKMTFSVRGFDENVMIINSFIYVMSAGKKHREKRRRLFADYTSAWFFLMVSRIMFWV